MGNDEMNSPRWARDIAILCAGVGIGSTIALLLAPASGEDARYAVSRGYRKTLKNIGRHTQGLRDRSEDLLENSRGLRDKLFHLGRGGRRAA